MIFRQRHLVEEAEGFTLLEALVAMALMAMLVMALTTVVSQWLPSWNHGFGRLQNHEEIAVGLDRITSDLSAAEFVSANRDTFLPLFDGNNHSATFVRTGLSPNSGPGLELIRISEQTDSQGTVLVRTRAPFVPFMRENRHRIEFGDPVVLFRAPIRLSFSYAGSDRIWHDEWHREPLLPEAIRLTLHDVNLRYERVVTATLVHAQLPVECLSAKSTNDCLQSKLRQSEIPSET